MPSRSGVCLHCHRLFQSDHGLTQHLRKCKARAEAYRYRYRYATDPPAAPNTSSGQVHDEQDATADREAYLPLASTSDAPLHDSSDDTASSASTSTVPDPDDDATADDHVDSIDVIDARVTENNDQAADDPLGLCTDLAAFGLDTHAQTSDPSAVTTPIEPDEDDPVQPSPDHDGGQDAPSSAGSSISLSAGRLSTSAIATGETITYSQATGNPAGVGRRSNSTEQMEHDVLQGFDNELDVGLANWLHDERISATAIDKLLKDPRMLDLTSQLSFSTAEELRGKIGNMQASANIGNWRKAAFTLPCASAPGGSKEYYMRYRSVEDAITFFLQHPGFKNDLIFEPYRAYTGDEPRRRVFGEMASGNWWWQTQARINIDGATVVPLIVASDKTLVTNHAGNLEAHAVYLSIGNVKMNTRHSNKRPGSLLLALLPIVKRGAVEERAAIFHECFRKLFDPMKRAADGEGLTITCSDGLVRRCFPIVAALTIDYPEQVTMTGVKYGKHCCVCKVPPDKREDLEYRAKWRTQADTKRQILYQRQLDRRQNRHRDKEMDIHDVDCFTFGYKYVDIHSTIMPDILHQLLKGVLMNAIDWTKALLADKLPEKSRAFREAVAAARAANVPNPSNREDRITDIIDRRFSVIPMFPELRLFSQYSKVTMWTGKEQKSMVKQLLVVFTPLLEEAKQPVAIKFLRAIVDFILLSGYPSHDNETLRYLEMALVRMNTHKEIFRKYRPRDTTTGTGHFNFPKWHALTHYVDFIRLYGSLRNYDTNHPEHNHVKMVKDAFKTTNKKIGWEDQVMEYGRRQMNWQAAFDEVGDSRPLTRAEQRELAEAPSRPNCAVNLEAFFGWGSAATAPTARVRHRKVDTTLKVSEAAAFMGEVDGALFREAAAVFVRNATQPGLVQDPKRLEDDSSWINKYDVQFHSSVTTQKPSGQDPDNPDAVEPSRVRAAPNWQGIKGNERRDWLWVQEFTVTQVGDRDGVAFQGRLPAQIIYIVTIIDPRVSGPTGRFSGVLVDIARPSSRGGRADEISGLISVKRVPPAPLQRPRRLNGRRIYPLTSTYHGIHVVPKHTFDQTDDAEHYINNTSDWDTYNTLYNDDWEQSNARQIVDGRIAERLAQRAIERRARQDAIERSREAAQAMADGRRRHRLAAVAL